MPKLVLHPHLSRCMVEAVRFDNIPRVDNVSVEDGVQLIAKHRMFEQYFYETPRGYLFATCKEPFDYGMPRQTMAFLLKECFEKRRTNMENMHLYLSPHLKIDDVTVESLITVDGSFNLLRMSNTSLLSLYQSVFYGTYVKTPKEPSSKCSPATHSQAIESDLCARPECTFDWVQCDECNKWRRTDFSKINADESWVCSMDSRNFEGCASVEEQMASDEQWSPSVSESASPRKVARI